MLNHSPENQRLVVLLQRVAQHDHAAFKLLYDLTSAHLYSVAMRLMRQRELADEVLQDAYINVWQQAGSYAATLSTPMTWLISIVRNKSLDRLRRSKLESDNSCSQEDKSSEQLPDEMINHADPQELFAAATGKLALGRCLALLEAPQRQALALAYYNGLSHAELAEQMCVPLGTAKAWIRRGLHRLKICLEPASLTPKGKP